MFLLIFGKINALLHPNVGHPKKLLKEEFKLT